MGEFTGQDTCGPEQQSGLQHVKCYLKLFMYVIITFEPVYYMFVFVLLTLKYTQLGMRVKDEI